MDWEAIINTILVQGTNATKDIQIEKVKEVAGIVAQAILSSETTIDDTLVKAVVLPNIDVFVAELKAKLA